MSADTSDYGPPERVLVELDWYDGPRAGICLVRGVPHRFQSNFDEADDEWLSTFRLAPIDQATLALEVEQWRIFVDWNDRYEIGQATAEEHPGNGETSARWDQIEKLVATSRDVPTDGKPARAAFERTEQEKRYSYDGTDYLLRWKLHE